jgi:hypothetical protein
MPHGCTAAAQQIVALHYKRSVFSRFPNMLLSTLRLCRAPLHRNYRFVRVVNYGLLPTTVKSKPKRSYLRELSIQRPLCYPESPQLPTGKPTVRENIYTFPNLLTVSRILACPVLGWSILESNFYLATSLLLYAGFTDLVCSSYLHGFRLMNLKYTVL